MNSFGQYLLEYNQDREYLRLRWKLIDTVLKKEKKYSPLFWEEQFKNNQGDAPNTQEALWYFAKEILHKMNTWDLMKFFGQPYRLSNKENLTIVQNEPEFILHLHNPSVEMQEYVIQKRPDLIGKIQNLDPTLKTKYQHEEELGRADL